MATAQEFIEAALRKIGVKSSEVPLKTSELTEGLDALNDLGNQLEAEGFELGFTTLSVVGDTVTIPAYANDFYKNQLAARLALEYGVEVGQTLTAMAQASRRTVIRNLNRKSVGIDGTYQSIIYAAIELLGAKTDDEPISTSEINNGLPRLNDLILELESRGFDLGYNMAQSGDITEQHGLPDWCLSWIKSSLAIRLAPTYGVEVNQSLIAMQRQAESAAYTQYAEVPLTDMPPTLPIGSNRGTWDNFYRSTTDDQILDGSGRPLTDDLGIMLTDGD